MTVHILDEEDLTEQPGLHSQAGVADSVHGIPDAEMGLLGILPEEDWRRQFIIRFSVAYCTLVISKRSIIANHNRTACLSEEAEIWKKKKNAACYVASPVTLG